MHTFWERRGPCRLKALQGPARLGMCDSVPPSAALDPASREHCSEYRDHNSSSLLSFFRLISQKLRSTHMCLRWTHASINRKMMFGDNQSTQDEKGLKKQIAVSPQFADAEILTQSIRRTWTIRSRRCGHLHCLRIVQHVAHEGRHHNVLPSDTATALAGQSDGLLERVYFFPGRMGLGLGLEILPSSCDRAQARALGPAKPGPGPGPSLRLSDKKAGIW
jgi:hypothetical protein